LPQFQRMVSFFIARAIFDGAVTFHFITDAEVSDVRIQCNPQYLFVNSTLIRLRRSRFCSRC